MTRLDVARRVYVGATRVGAIYRGSQKLATTRTNFATDPQPTLLSGSNVLGWHTGRWFGKAPAAGTHTLVTGATDGPVGITCYLRKTWTASPPLMTDSGDTGFQIGGTAARRLAVQPGEIWTFSAYLRPSIKRNLNLDVYCYAADGVTSVTPSGWGSQRAFPSGALIRPGVTASRVLAEAGQWARVSLTMTVPEDVYKIDLMADSNGVATNGEQLWGPGDTLDGTALLAERGSELRPYFDPLMEPRAEWTGVASRSASTLWTL
ncbi:hypothetical protein [Cellulomonas uda]|uniref:Uncharacterized protein n=1 Tax=Cellulomonas uda TaxID=1714 RepID=A0A4Y3K7D3_CELUD|nr:hypothetical protein [Cellulomonas uda]NII67830.1 hypothetical protein [Cellulomonas uda]GEA79923.1 hypothetical protein CUD01_03670 [Cellulomonas uda]